MKCGYSSTGESNCLLSSELGVRVPLPAPTLEIVYESLPTTTVQKT